MKDSASQAQSAHSAHLSSRLIFRWPERTASFLLPSLFLLAVAVHGLTFYVFQIVYPPTVSIAPPPAQITLLTPNSPENEALLKWVEAQSPAAAPRLQTMTPRGLGEVHYVPSYASVHTLPKSVDKRIEGTPFPSAYPPARSTHFAATAPVKAAVPSVFTLSPELASRDAQTGIALPTPSASSQLPTVFLVGLSDRGELRYSFLQTSSGDPAVDQKAEEWLHVHEFKRADGGAPIAWGLATFAWGAAPSSTAQ